MDSLTQIILGAAAGEVVLGKKIGNRALLWGAIAGTIPDLDVLGGLFLNSVDNISFHRGISHSITFSVLGAFLFGWLVHKLYEFLDSRREKPRPKASLKGWQWLFFWGLFTHPILDCFTMYGTELFAPFSDARIAWATISVADPLYTIPFLICLIVASFFKRESKKRRFWNYLGIGLSSCYLLFTVVNKQLINNKFEEALSVSNIAAERYSTNASILNNILWSCMAETKEAFYTAQYSWFDEGEIEFVRIEKNHELIHNIDEDPTILELRKFSKDYFTVIPIGDQLQYNDLRFGTFYGKGDEATDFPFRFIMDYDDSQGYMLQGTLGGPAPGQEKEMMAFLWNRIWGDKERIQ
jgi:inner membrane protein